MRATLCVLRRLTAALFLASALLFVASPVFAQPSKEDPFTELLQKVRSIEERLRKVEANQQEILEGQEKTLAAVENVRIWATRR